MKALTTEISRVQRIANLQIGSLTTSKSQRARLRSLTFELIELEDNLPNFSEIALSSKVADFNSKAPAPTLKLSFKKSAKEYEDIKEFKLTKKELEILSLLPSGLSIKSMAADLYLTESTIKTHLSAIYRKLGVANRVQAISKARECNLLAL